MIKIHPHLTLISGMKYISCSLGMKKSTNSLCSQKHHVLLKQDWLVVLNRFHHSVLPISWTDGYNSITDLEFGSLASEGGWYLFIASIGTICNDFQLDDASGPSLPDMATLAPGIWKPPVTCLYEIFMEFSSTLSCTYILLANSTPISLSLRSCWWATWSSFQFIAACCVPKWHSWPVSFALVMFCSCTSKVVIYCSFLAGYPS